jgi:hypothetical protein
MIAIPRRILTPEQIYGCSCCCPIPTAWACSACNGGNTFPSWSLTILGERHSLPWASDCTWTDGYFTVNGAPGNWVLSGTMRNAPSISFTGTSSLPSLKAKTVFTGMITSGTKTAPFSAMITPTCHITPLTAYMFIPNCPADPCCASPIYNGLVQAVQMDWDWTLFNGQGGFAGAMGDGLYNYRNLSLDAQANLYITTNQTIDTSVQTYGPLAPYYRSGMLPFGNVAAYQIPYYDPTGGNRQAIIEIGTVPAPYHQNAGPVLASKIFAAVSNCPVTRGPLYVTATATLSGAGAVYPFGIYSAPLFTLGNYIGLTQTFQYTLEYDQNAALGSYGPGVWWVPGMPIGTFSEFPTIPNGSSGVGGGWVTVNAGRTTGIAAVACGTLGIIDSSVPQDAAFPPTAASLFPNFLNIFAEHFDALQTTEWSVNICPFLFKTTWLQTGFTDFDATIPISLTVTVQVNE